MFAWKPGWVWPFPVAGFVGYILAFRHGMLLWNSNIDRIWRHDSRFGGRDGLPPVAGNIRVLHPAPPHGPRPDRRAVR